MPGGSRSSTWQASRWVAGYPWITPWVIASVCGAWCSSTRTGIQPQYPPQWLSYLLVRIPFVTEMTYLSTRSRSAMRASLGQLVRTPGALTEELLDAVLAESRKPRAGKAFNAFQKHETLWHGLRTNFMPRLDQVAARTLIVHGGADTLVPVQYAKEACWMIPDCRLEVLPGAGHWAQRDRPEEFITLVNEFLSAP